MVIVIYLLHIYILVIYLVFNLNSGTLFLLHLLQSRDGKSPLHMTAVHGRFTRSQTLIQNGESSLCLLLSQDILKLHVLHVLHINLLFCIRR